ncbi:MAG: DUF11 domain-containing protein, partial [Bifidobacteriaceae bacterium]|nr:DUF11 domain-containing protein [Bifidobacteriaceae bacterium]
TYTVTVAVTDTYGTVGTISHTITVANEDPYIWSYHPDPYALGYDVPWVPDIGFADPSSQDTDNLSCHWDYGDGTTRAIPPPCSIDEAVEPHMYTLGTFAPTLTVSDPDGATVTHTDHVTVSPARTYISLYAVAGSASAGQITVRAKLWNADAWTEMPGQPIEFTVGTHAVTVTTDASGVAEVRIDRLPGQDATAVFPGTSTHQTGSDTTDLARYGLPQGDIIFTADESGSMHFIATALRTNLTFMASQLAASLDYQLGLMGFGSSAHFLPQLHLPATDSLADFDAAASQLRSDGGIEPGIDAIGEAVQPRVGLRPEAAACVVLIGDEHAQQENWTVPRAEQALADADATLFAIITPDPTTQAYSDLAVGSGGAVFDIQDFRQDPGPILSALLTRCVASVTERPDLAVDVTDNVAVTGPGVGQTVAVTVRNDGQADASGVVVRTTVRGPASVTSVSDGGTATSLAGGRTEVVWNLNSLSAGDTRHLAIEIAVDGTAANGDVLRYEADVADDGTLGADLTPDNNTDVDTTDVVREPPEPELDLAVTITDHVATVRPGAGATADVEVTNPSNRDAQGVELTVTVTGPISITSVSDGGTATPLASGGFRVTWPAFDLPVFAPGEPRSFAVAVDGSAQGGDIVRYVAEISVPGTVAQDTNPDNDTAEDTTVVVARPDIAVTVDDGETQLRAGDAATVRIEATNVGTVHVTAVTMTVTVTGPLTITSVSDGGTFAALLGGGYRVTWPAFDLLAGGVERRTIEVTVDGSAQDGASAAYDASVSDDGVHGEDLALANNTSHDTTGIIAPDAIPSTTPGTTPSTTPSPAPSTTPPTTPPISPSSTPGASTPLVPLETPGTPSANSPDPLDDDEEQEQDQDTEALPDTGAGALGTRVAWSVALAGFGLMLALGTRRRWHTG